MEEQSEGQQLIVFPVEGAHAVGFVTKRTDRGLIVRKLLEFQTLEYLEFHAYRILDYVGKIRKGSVPQVIIDAFDE